MTIDSRKIGTTLPSRGGSDGNAVDALADAYGNSYSRNLGKPASNLAAAGATYFVKNATSTTGIAGIAAATAKSDTQAFLHLYNSASAVTGSSLVLDWLKIRVTVAGLNGAATGFYHQMYSGATRYSSGGTAYTSSIVNCNMGSSNTPSCTFQVGALTLGAANGTERLLDNEQLRSVIAVAGDHFWFDFAPAAMSAHNGLVVSGTAISNLVMPCAPVVIGPSCGWQFGIYGASQDTAAQYEFALQFHQL